MCGPCRWGGDTLRLVSPQHIVHSRSALSPSPFRCHSRSQPVLAFRPGMPSRSLSVLLALGRSLYQRVASRRHLLLKIGRATLCRIIHRREPLVRLHAMESVTGEEDMPGVYTGTCPACRTGLAGNASSHTKDQECRYPWGDMRRWCAYKVLEAERKKR